MAMNGRTFLPALVVAALAVGNLATVQAAEGPGDKPKGPEAEKAKEVKPQTTCPVMGGKIDKKIFADVDGYRIYACCGGCLARIKADSKKHIQKIVDQGETPERLLVVCPKCGEIKGSEKCCAPDAKKCGVCKLNKGSPACCKGLKPAKGEKDIILCGKCGEVKGTDKCCRADAPKCAKCGPNKGAPACCKLKK